MARLSVNQKWTKKTWGKRGFVLSFSTFALAIFLVVFAQLQYSHLQTLQLDASDIHQTSTPARVLRDMALDFNSLLGQNYRVDQNLTHTIITFSGKFPEPLDDWNNLLRYQTGLITLGRDTNTSIFLDLNQMMGDRNIVGRSNRHLKWWKTFDENSLLIQSTDSNHMPIIIDVNITSSIPFDTNVRILSLGLTTWPYTFHYRDTNSSHSFSETESAGNFAGKSYNLTYTGSDGNSHTLNVGFGSIVDSDASAPLLIEIRGNTNVEWSYAVSATYLNDLNGTRMGYDIDTTIRGNDMNIDTNTIWTWGSE